MTTYEVAAIKACQRAGSQITECEDGPKCDGCQRNGTRAELIGLPLDKTWMGPEVMGWSGLAHSSEADPES